ncbi:MAG: hypothetical protein ACQGVC_21245 [Myxococcota bacterium]
MRAADRAGTWRRRLLLLTVAIVSGASVGCPAFHTKDNTVDRTPVVDTGAGASIIYPGQSAPTYQGAYHPKVSGKGSYGPPAPQANPAGAPPQGSYPPAPAPTQSPAPAPQGAYGAPQGAVPPQGPDPYGRRATSGAPAPAPSSAITMIGGNTTEVEVHQKVDEAPVWWKYVTLPFAVVAAPFVYAADKVRGEPTPGPEVPTLDNAPPPPPPGPAPTDYETARLRQMEEELNRRQGAPAPQAAPAYPPRQAAPTQAPQAGSFAEELAALRRVPAPVATPRPERQQPAPRATTAAVARPDANPQLAAASGHVDRDGDGATDQWIFRERGEIVRELLDEDFDGRPDRTLHYDLATHEIRAIEEDANHDGRVDTWTQLKDGAILRRRADDDGDGHVDTWSYFRSGTLARLERDSTGDGFRDRVSHYENGRLAREEQDDDGDGRADAVRTYDANEQVARLEEDSDGDGRIDVISHYQDGRLKRREVLDASVLAPAPLLTEHN